MDMTRGDEARALHQQRACDHLRRMSRAAVAAIYSKQSAWSGVVVTTAGLLPVTPLLSILLRHE